MNGEHPWRDWLYVIGIFLAGLIVVMIAVKLMINWAHRNDRPKGGPDQHPE